jgi:alpha-galactosidase
MPGSPNVLTKEDNMTATNLIRKTSILATSCAILTMLFCGTASAKTVYLSSLDLSKIPGEWHTVSKDNPADTNLLSIAGHKFDNGIDTRATSILGFDLKGKAKKFHAAVGIDDDMLKRGGTVDFIIIADNKIIWKSGTMRTGEGPNIADVPLDGVHELVLIASETRNASKEDHCVWADARIEMIEGEPIPTVPEDEKAVILTPPAPASPRINGARIYGVRPNHPFLYYIPATGDRPMKFSAKHLPKGLSLDSKTGIITGTITSPEKKTYIVTFRAKNSKGKASREFKIVVGDKIALTPPMGWNSWNCFARAVTAKDIRATADGMVKSGLINHGWTYINIDDFWEKNVRTRDPSLKGPGRDKDGFIVPNPRFPDMKGLFDYIHSLGLKAGLYSSPGPVTCGWCIGSYQHEEKDAQRYAEWGTDYLKYDWCSYRNVATGEGLERLQKPYRIMHNALAKQKRDIVYSICQYGRGNVSSWGADVGGNCWRTTSDIVDTWQRVSSIGFGQARLAKYAEPGHWNDADMLTVGVVGWGKLHPSRLTANEQYTHVSLWCLLTGPLLLGCDMSQIDDFTIGLLSNDEVIEINQDPLGKQAERLVNKDNIQIWAKKMEDGSTAVGLFNLNDFTTDVTVNWQTLNLNGKQIVRDLWRQKDLGEFSDSFTSPVARHGVRLIRIRPSK